MMKIHYYHYYYLLVIFSLIICRNNVAAANDKDKDKDPPKPPVPAPTPSVVKRVRVDISPFYLLVEMDNPTSDNVNLEILEGGTNEFFDNHMIDNKESSYVKSVFSATVITDNDNDTTNRYLRRSLISNSDGKTKTIIQMDGFARFDASNAPTKDEMKVLEKVIFDDEYVNHIEQMKGITDSNVPLQVQMAFDKSDFDLNTGTGSGSFEQIGGGSNGNNAGGIAGGVIGAFVVFCVASLLFVKLRRGNDNEEEKEENKRSTLKTSASLVKKRNNIYINHPIGNDAKQDEKKSTSKKRSQKTDIMANDDGSVFEMIFPNSQISLSHGLRKVFATSPQSSPQRINTSPNDYDDAYSLDGSDGIDESKPNIGDQMLGQVLALNELGPENMLVSPNNTINTHSPVDMSSYSYSYEGVDVEIFSGEKKEANNKFRRETMCDLEATRELEFTSSQDNDNIVWHAFDETNSTNYNEDAQVKSSVSTPCLMDDCLSSPESQTSFMPNKNAYKERRIDHGSYRVIETERVHNIAMPKSSPQKRKAKITVITEAPSPPKTPDPGRFPIQAANSYRAPHNYVEDSESESSEKYESGSGMDDNSMGDESDVEFASQQVKNDKRMIGKQKEGIIRPALVDCNHFPSTHPNPAHRNNYDNNRSIGKNLAYDPAEARNSRKNRLTRSLIVDPSRKCNVENHSKAELASNLRKTRLQRQQVSSPKVSRSMRNSRYR